jgi:hypothetical protein
MLSVEMTLLGTKRNWDLTDKLETAPHQVKRGNLINP